MEERIKIYSYGKVWRIERKIYSLGNITLPFAVNPSEALSFFGALIVISLLIKIISPLAALPAVIRFFLLPYIITRYLMKKKLDGKNPVMYLAGLLGYWITESNTYIEGFRKYRDEEQVIKQNWRCSRRRDAAQENGQKGEE